MKNTIDDTTNSTDFTRWTLGDIADYEYLVHGDRDKDEDYLHERDRDIFLKWLGKREKNLSLNISDKVSLLRYWLEIGRNKMGAGEKVSLPGTAVTKGLHFLKILVIVSGLFAGSALVRSLLHYEGKHPINVSDYFFIVILFQIFLLIIIALTPLLMKLRSSDQFSQNVCLTSRIFGPVFTWITRKVYVARLKLIPRHERRETLGWLEEIADRSSLYNYAIRWHLASVVQWFGIFFNIAAIGTFFVLIVFSDRAFGWQTSVQGIDETIVYQLCRFIALPWTWIFPEGIGYPDPQQIKDTRIFLHESVEYLSGDALHTWWPFLILATTLYGLVPRLALTMWIHGKTRSIFKSFSFNDYQSNKLLRRLTTPVVVKNAGEEEEIPVPFVTPSVSPPIVLSSKGDDNRENLVLISVDLKDELDNQVVRQEIVKRFGAQVQEFLIFGHSASWDREVKETLRSKKIAQLFMIDQDWNVPTLQDLERIRQFMNASGEQSWLTIVLTGVPDQGTPTTVNAEHLRVWKLQSATLNQPRPEIEALVK